MIRISNQLSINEDEIQFTFVRASGPGGQKVNKASTAVQLRFDIANSRSLTPEIRERLLKRSKNRINEDGILIIEAQRYRSQARNRKDALDRLLVLLRDVSEPQKPRLKTEPTLVSKERRIRKKRQQAEKKRLRRRVDDLNEI
ncbi:MAG: alternative ribosome rescue aminoacyl-tRNA hydrolase ArfB [Anaerolineales bacterium]|jgi:ribosome-associated protein